MPIVDVLIPTYNRSSMLRQCLDSVRNQVFQDFQVTIGDDRSSDATPEIAEEYCSLDSRFRYVRNTKNMGQWANVNNLLTGVSAPYVHILHDDDWIESRFYAELLPVLDSSPGTGLVFCRSVVSQVGNEYPPTLPVNWPGGIRLPRERAFQWVLKWQAVPLDAVLFKTSSLREVGAFAEEFMSSDWLMWLKWSAGHGIAMVDSPLAHYRIHGAQMSTDRLRLYKDILKMLTFACSLPAFEAHTTELSEARFSMFQSYVLTLKEADRPGDDILALASLFRQMDRDHLGDARRVVNSALAYAALPSWVKHGVMAKGSRLRRFTKRLFGFGTFRGVDA